MSINKVTLIGNVGKDPEIKTVTSDNIKVATFSLATSEGTKEHPVTLWHNIKCWNKLAEVVEIYVKKGSKLYVEGSIFYREWEKDGVKHSATDINCQKIELLDSHKENGEKAPSKSACRRDEKKPEGE